jgi:2'-5' RNA ligase
MSAPLYALVAYVRSPVGRFVEDLRRDLHPQYPVMPAHLTVLPPRHLQGPEPDAYRFIEDICQKVTPFEVVMGDVESFAPATPTVFIRVARAGYRMRELHDHLNTGPLLYDEPWPYMPHLTIVKLGEGTNAVLAAETCRSRWLKYNGSRRILIDQLTFVREGIEPYTWVDLAPIPLGSSLQSPVASGQ